MRGLTDADFTVLVDGQPRRIAAFSAIEVPVPTAPEAERASRRAPADVATNDITRTPEARLIVIVLDDALIPFEPRFIASAKQIARRVVERAADADQLAVVFPVGSGGAQNFTRDRTKLLAAIDSFTSTSAKYTLGWDSASTQGRPQNTFQPGTSPFALADPDSPLRMVAMRTLRDVGETLLAAPQRRKLLVYISPGIGVDVESASAPMSISTRTGNVPVMAMKDQNRTLFQDMRDLFDRLRFGNVTVYPIDPCGVGGLEAYVQQVAASLRSLREATAAPPPGYDWLAPTAPPAPDALARHLTTLASDFALAAAAHTGGRAILNTNEFDSGVDRIFEENSAYYLLGFETTARDRPGSLHRLVVKVNRPDVEVRTRSGHDMPRPVAASASRVSRAAAATVSPVPVGDLPLRLHAVPLGTTADESVVAIVIGVDHPAVSTRTRQTFDIEIGAFTPAGQRKGQWQHTATATLRPERGGARATFELLAQVQLPPGRYELRVGVAARGEGPLASVFGDVEVPAPDARGISVIGPMLSVAPPVPAAPAGLFDKWLPITPTARRVFSPLDRVTAWQRVSLTAGAAGVPVEVAARVVGTAGEVVFEANRTIPAEDVASNRADFQVSLPVPLAAGSYVLYLTTAAGRETVQHAIPFVIR